METHGLDVRGMKCEGCAGSVESALEGVDGVRAVTVSLDDERAEVTADGSVRADDLVRAVEEAGYQASPAG